MPGLSGFRDNETGHARANVVTPPPTLEMGVHVRTCRDAPPTHDLWKART